MVNHFHDDYEGHEDSSHGQNVNYFGITGMDLIHSFTKITTVVSSHDFFWWRRIESQTKRKILGCVVIKVCLFSTSTPSMLKI